MWKKYIDEKKEQGKLYKWLRRMFALPLLRSVERNKIWNHLNNFKMENEIDEEICEFLKYFEREWINKQGNLWNFNKLTRTRNTNPAEAFHSMLNKLSIIIYKIIILKGSNQCDAWISSRFSKFYSANYIRK